MSKYTDYDPAFALAPKDGPYGITSTRESFWTGEGDSKVKVKDNMYVRALVGGCGRTISPRTSTLGLWDIYLFVPELEKGISPSVAGTPL